MKKNNISPILRPYAIWIFIFIAFSLFFHVAGAYNFCYLEQWQTFIYDSSYVLSILMQPGGFAQLSAAFLTQFFLTPAAGILITAFLLSSLSMCMGSILHRWTGNHHLFPSALLPALAFAFLHYNTNYLYAGTIAFLLMLAVLNLHLRIRNDAYRCLYSLLITILLFLAAGSIATLYAALVLIIECFDSPKKSIAFLPLVAIVYLSAQCSLWWGYFGEWKHALLSDAYFTLRLPAGSIIHLPWGITVGIFLTAGLYKHFGPFSRWKSHAFQLIQGAIACIFLYQGYSQYLSPDNETFKKLNYHIRQEQWNRIVSESQKLPMTNLLHQNCLNLAFAEKGELLPNLSKYPNIGLQSLFIGGNKTPYISALLNDIYFSMGHMAFAQRYAFEANESMGGYSPKLLKRLVQTSLIYGNYNLALKYIQILEKTLFYHEWAKSQRAFLHDDSRLQADSILGSKRKCLFPDNRFAGSLGLDKDLEEILKQNPSHTATHQYLKAIELFTGKNQPRP